MRKVMDKPPEGYSSWESFWQYIEKPESKTSIILTKFLDIFVIKAFVALLFALVIGGAVCLILFIVCKILGIPSPWEVWP